MAVQVKKGDLLYEGKAKKVYKTSDDTKLIVSYKDDATAFNGEKKGRIEDKGIVNNQMSNLLMQQLEEKGIQTHYIETLNDRETLVKKVTIIPLEVIVRNVATGSLVKRVGLKEGLVLEAPILELCYKDDALGDPLINDDHVVALNAATLEELTTIREMALIINQHLIETFKVIGIRLIDFKLEFGKTVDGAIVLADEISPDTCRFWDLATGEKLDKDRFRQNLGGEKEAYQEVMTRLFKKEQENAILRGGVDDALEEECGIFGVYTKEGETKSLAMDTARMTYYGLFSLQHRGQESAGIATNHKGTILYRKEMGLITEVFDDVVLDYLQGHSGIGHLRYSTAGSKSSENAQPLVMKYTKGQMAIAHNGNITNAKRLRRELEDHGAMFQTSTDSEVIAALLSRARIKYNTIEEALVEVMGQIEGAYSLLVMTPHKLIAARDPFGMRPLVIGQKGETIAVSSESCSFDALGFDLVRDVKPGEIVIIDDEGQKSIQYEPAKKAAMCVFEYVYFARPDSIMQGVEVYNTRYKAGKILYEEHPLEADVVVGVPDSGLAAALGFSHASGIPVVGGFMKNRYVGRTFIQPNQTMRELGVHLKLNPIKSLIKGKRVVLIDDSIVRGTTSRHIVNLLKEAGAKEVHMRISSPPVTHSCYFGIDTPERQKLVAAHHTVEEICDMICADSLGYISREGLVRSCDGADIDFCTSCFTGNYPIKVDEEAN